MIKKLIFTVLLIACAQAAMADSVLYAEVEGTGMILKFGEKPDDTETIKYYKFDGTSGWNGTFYTTITTATVDASCASFNGTSLTSLFDGFAALTVINDIDKLNTSNVVEMNRVFADCSVLTTLDLRQWNTSNVTNMAMMFYHCSGLTSLRIGSWNTSNVTNQNQMFDGCSSLTQLNLASWNTAKVTSMTSMFQGCTQLVTIYVDAGWNTDAVTSSDLMFYNCDNIKGADGTTYDPSKLNKTYARIGDGGENKGYLSGGDIKTNLAEGRRWATWYSDGHTYVIDEEGADAYAAEYDAANSSLILHKIGKTIPKQKAVIIVADADNESIVMTVDDDASAEMPTNNLDGADVEVSVQGLKDLLSDRAGVEHGSGTIYVMGMVDSKFGFYKYTAENMPAHKAFLYLPPSLSGVRAITFGFSDITTDVKEVKGVQEVQEVHSDIWYALDGRKYFGKPTVKGIYIHEGKKIIITGNQ